MSSSQSRLELQIDIFEKAGQRALALPDLTPPELVDSILQEFRELEYLSDSPADYQLFKATDKSPLDNEDQIKSQVSTAERLVLVELIRRHRTGGRRGQRSGKQKSVSGLHDQTSVQLPSCCRQARNVRPTKSIYGSWCRAKFISYPGCRPS